MSFDFTTLWIFFQVWADFLSAVIGFVGTVVLGISAKLIPWGLRMQKKLRHPFKIRPIATNGAGQATSSREEWWGAKLVICGWCLLSISFLIQLVNQWPRD